MSTPSAIEPGAIDLASNLETTLRGRPRLVRLFLGRRMACPGCPMARFETLADAARHHGMDGGELLAAVRAAVAPAARKTAVRETAARKTEPRRPGGAERATPAGGADGRPPRHPAVRPAPPSARRRDDPS